MGHHRFVLSIALLAVACAHHGPASDAPMPAPALVLLEPVESGALSLVGRFTPDGSRLAEVLAPVLLPRSAATPAAPEGVFRVRIDLAGGGQVLHPFDALVSVDAPGRPRHGAFRVVVAFDRRPLFLSVTDASGSREFARFEFVFPDSVPGDSSTMNAILHSTTAVPWLALWIAAAGVAPPPSVTCGPIVVSQCYQRMASLGGPEAAFEIPLYAGRSTCVRVPLQLAPPAGGPLSVRGSLSVSATPITGPAVTIVVGPVAGQELYAVPAASDIFSEAGCLTFEIAQMAGPTGATIPPTSAIPVSNDVDFTVTVEVLDATSELIETLAFQRLDEVFLAPIAPDLRFTRVDYRPQDSAGTYKTTENAGLPDETLIAMGTGDAFVRATYPIDDTQTGLYSEFPTHSVEFNLDEGLQFEIDDYPDGDALLVKLAGLLDTTTADTTAFGPDTFLYGWVKGNPTNNLGGTPVNGMAMTGGRVAWGNTDPLRFQRTYAHELGHNFGLDHPPFDVLAPGEWGWDVHTRLKDNPATNLVDAKILFGSFTHDLMVPAKLTNQAWVWKQTYLSLESSYLAGLVPADSRDSTPEVDRDGPAHGPAWHPLAAAAQAPEDVIHVRGILRRDGSGLLGDTLPPVLRMPWPAWASRDEPAGPFFARVEFQRPGGTREQNTLSFQGRVCAEGIRIVRPGAFDVALPVPRDAELLSVEIGTKANLVPFRGSLSSSQAPSIQILSPSSGAQLLGRVLLEWSSSDPDPGTRLSHHILFSNGGLDWQPIAVDLGPVQRFEFDSSQLPGSGQVSSEGVLAVIASDGLMQSEARITGLTVQ